MNQKSFTLIELVIVLGILAILAVVVIIVLNPAEFLKQSRDSTRMSDLQTINKSLGLYQADGGTSFGSTNKVYVSIPDSSTTCANLGLPSLPTGWEYRCSNSDNYRKVDSTGWIPVNLTSITFGSTLDTLPIDPINTTSSGNYYTYVIGGSWELNAILESSRYRNNTSIVKRNLPGVFAVGSNLSLSPITNTSGLVGYWKFDEGSGTTASDSSGNNRIGYWYGTGTRWTSGKVGSYAGQFNGSNDYVAIANLSGLLSDTQTIVTWVKYAGCTYCTIIDWSSGVPSIRLKHADRPIIYLAGGNYRYFSATNPTNIYDDNWHHAAFVITGNAQNDINNSKIYIDGKEQAVSGTTVAESPGSKIVFRIGYGWYSGLIDDVRIYNRALSAAEIAAIYNATK